jgi:hypothetical protein
VPAWPWETAKARDVAKTEADGRVDVELLIIDRAGETVGHAGFGTP